MKRFWKTRLGTCIYENTNGAKVYQNLTYRWLTLNSDIIQSLINRYQPNKPSLKYIETLSLAIRELPSNACLLGLGGGGFAHTVYNNQLTAVESNSDIIQIASDYFMLDRLKNLVIVHQDASLFVKTCQTKYNHLIIDIHNSYGFPKYCMNSEFFYWCKNILLPNGILAINIANTNDFVPISKILDEHFACKVICAPNKGIANLVIFACKSPSTKFLLNLFEQSSQVKKLTWDAAFGYIATL
jgi:spermidine synthase